MSQNATNAITKNIARTRGLVAALTSVLVSALSVVGAPAQMAQAAAPSAAPCLPQIAPGYTCLWYVVRRGDTLLELADRYNTDVLTLRRINGLKTTRIFIGQRLCIPRYNAPNPGPGSAPSGPWYAEYWNNITQSGPAALVRNDPSINFNWGFGSPDPSRIFADNFSARWTRNINFTGGVWRFGFDVDDGVRLTIDDEPELDLFSNVGNVQRTKDVTLSPGLHRIVIDFVEKGGKALIVANIVKINTVPQPPAPPDNGKYNNGPWQAQYYPNLNFQGSASAQTECCLRFDWHGNPPLPGFPGNNWTARYSQTRNFNAGVYQLVARVDDGIRIYINGVLVMNEWHEQSTRTFTSNVKLSTGGYKIVVEYAQFGGSSDLSMYWDFLGNPDAPQPQVQVVPSKPAVGPATYIAPLP